MTEPSRARAAASYLERLGIRPPRRREPAVEIGEARPVPPPDPAEAFLESANRRPSGVAEDPNASGQMAAAELNEEIPSEWIRTARGPRTRSEIDDETQRVEARARAAADAEARREAAVSRAYDRSFIEGLSIDPRVEAVPAGFGQGITLGFADELEGLGRSLAHGTRYTDERDEIRENNEDLQRTAPGFYGGAEFVGGLVPAMAIPSAGAGASLTRRVLTSAVGNAGYGGVSGYGHSRRSGWDAARDARDEALIGGVTGAGAELAMAGGRRLWNRYAPAPEGTPLPGRDFTPEQMAEMERRLDAGDPDLFDMATTRAGLEDAAAQRRVRSTADAAALSDVRRAGDYHGPGGEGYRGLARDLDETGISPRGSLTRASTAQERAARMENQAGRELGEIGRRMEAATRSGDPAERILANTDDELAALSSAQRSTQAPTSVRDEAAIVDAATGQARGGRARPRGVSMRDRPTEPAVDFGDLNTPTPPAPENYGPTYTGAEARAAINEVADPALVRYSGTFPSVGASGRVTHVPAGETADRLRAEAAERMGAATTPEQRASAGALDSLADDVSRLPPETYRQAQARLRALDEEAAYGTRYPNAPGASPERTGRARSTRGGVRADMDAAVERTLGPDVLDEAQAARGRFGTARAVSVLGERGAAREAANLQAGLGDTIAIHAGLSRQGGPTERLWNAVEGVIVNRYLRGSGHALVATAQEMQSDAMAREIVRRLAEQPTTAPMARALAEAQRRGPRAFGVALATVARDRPEVQAVIAPIVLPEPDYGVQYADEIEASGDVEDDGEDVDYGVPYADEYDEQGTPRRQQR